MIRRRLPLRRPNRVCTGLAAGEIGQAAFHSGGQRFLGGAAEPIGGGFAVAHEEGTAGDHLVFGGLFEELVLADSLSVELAHQCSYLRVAKRERKGGTFRLWHVPPALVLMSLYAI